MKQIPPVRAVLTLATGFVLATSTVRATTATLNLSPEVSVSEWNASDSADSAKVIDLLPTSDLGSGTFSASPVVAEGKEPIKLPGLPPGPKAPAGTVPDTGSTAAFLGLALVGLAAVRRKLLRAT